MSSQDFSPAPYPFYAEEGPGAEVFPSPLRPAERYWLHGLLFVLTMLTTSMVGVALQLDFDRNLPFDVEHTLDTYALVWRHPAELLAGLPFSLTLAAILLAHEIRNPLAGIAGRVTASSCAASACST